MSTRSVSDSALLEQLSALADGELDDTAAACACWRGDAGARASWHVYHLIGDVLRSEDLAAAPSRDAAFLHDLRGRLAREPIVVAPGSGLVASGIRRSGNGRWSWLAASAVAAGFFVVIGVFMLTRTFEPSASPGATLARADAPAAVVPRADDVRRAEAYSGPDSAVAVPVSISSTGRLIRDPQLDAYLAAHKQFAGSSALGAPSTFLRSATVDAYGR